MEWNFENETYHLIVNHSEFTALNNCMNEALEWVPEQVFQTRVGVEYSEVQDLLYEFRQLRYEMNKRHGNQIG